MKKSNGIIIGAIFILIGFLYACSALRIFDFSIFFPGWWTLFIIVPCAYGLFRKNEDKTGYIIGLVIGACFFINAQDFDFHIDFWPMAVALLCIVIGVKMIFPQNKSRKHFEFVYNSNADGQTEAVNGAAGSSYGKGSNGYLNLTAVLGGKEVRVDNECFTGADITAVMGAVELDLRNAIISEDVYVNISAVMGGVDIYVPANTHVVTDGCSTVMGGIDVHPTYVNHVGADAPRIIMTGGCVMGGIDIK